MICTHYTTVIRNGEELELDIAGEIDVFDGERSRGCYHNPDATVTAVMLAGAPWAGQLTAEEDREAERSIVQAWRDGVFDAPSRSYADRGDYEYDRMKDEGL